MINNRPAEKISYYLLRPFYIVLRSFYNLFKFFIKPVFRLHPRLYRFGVKIKEAGKELIRPHEIEPELNWPELNWEVVSQPDTEINNRIKKKRNRVPGWLVDEWRAIHEIEPQLFPEKSLAKQLHFYTVPDSRIGRHYLELCELYGDDVSHVFLVPWLVTGGADLVALNYVQALIAQNMEKNIVVIATLDVNSTWKDRLPEKTRFIEFGKMYAGLSSAEQEKLLVRLLLQMAPQVIHNINSELGYKIFVKYGNALRSISKLYASVFCFDITEEGRRVGYPVSYLPGCFDFLEAVFSDNHTHLDKLEEIYAFDKRKMHVHYQPAPLLLSKKKSYVNPEKKYFDILWAGRLDRQKRPDVFIKIVEQCMDLPFKFHVYGSSVLDMDIYSKKFKKMENIIYNGPFNGLDSLPVGKYDLFLYTSQWDGLPNVLLEAISLGLPVVASNVGGIGELIQHKKTGFLIDPYDDIDKYVSCLQKIYNDRSVLAAMVDSASELIAIRHCWDSFYKDIKNIPYYG